MADVFTAAKRSEVMSRIRSHGNKGTELRLLALLKEHRITGWRRQFPIALTVRGGARKVKPDFVFKSQRVAVFVDGCFWHGCPRCYVRPAQNRRFWDTKVLVNQARDRRQSRALRAQGWSVIRIRECALCPRRAGAVMRRLNRALEASVLGQPKL